MVEKCANSACSASFRRLREGRVFVIEGEADSRIGNGRARLVRYFWLCNSCCRTMTVIGKKKQGIEVVPLPSATANRAAS